MGLFHVWHSGVKYAETWPENAVLNNVFREGTVIAILRKSARALPPVLAMVIIWAYCSGSYLPDSFRYIPWLGVFVIAANCILIPLSGYWWLGRKAESPLPEKTRAWYCYICNELNVTAELKPTGLSLARVLKKASADGRLFKEIIQKM